MNTGSMKDEGVTVFEAATTSTTASVGSQVNAGIIHRYYDPNTGRYLTPDPLGVESDPSLYSYAAGNPLIFVDPEGLTVQLCQRVAKERRLEAIGANHMWIATDSVVAGVGPAGEGDAKCGNVTGSYKIQVTDQSAEMKPSGGTRPSCVVVNDIDEACVNKELVIGRQLGTWSIANNCVTFIQQVLAKCTKECAKPPFLPPPGGFPAAKSQ